MSREPRPRGDLPSAWLRAQRRQRPGRKVVVEVGDDADRVREPSTCRERRPALVVDEDERDGLGWCGRGEGRDEALEQLGFPDPVIPPTSRCGPSVRSATRHGPEAVAPSVATGAVNRAQQSGPLSDRRGRTRGVGQPDPVRRLPRAAVVGETVAKRSECPRQAFCPPPAHSIHAHPVDDGAPSIRRVPPSLPSTSRTAEQPDGRRAVSEARTTTVISRAGISSRSPRRCSGTS